MKTLLGLFILTLTSLNCEAQDKGIWTKMDTIRRYPDKVLIHYKTFQDSLLIEDSQAFLIPTTILIPRFYLFPQLLKRKLQLIALCMMD